MSDSSSDFTSPNKVLPFTNKSSVIMLKGPNIDRQFHFNMNKNSSVQRFRDDVSQRCFRHRELSPTNSMRSLDMGSRNFRQSFYHGGFAQSSVINGMEGRAVSPSASMLSTGSNMSTAASIISAFKSGNFKKHELNEIKNAFNKCFKSHVRKKISRRRNLKLYMKGARRKSGDDSGELGSDSSISSDDCKSSRTGYILQNSSSQYMNSYRNNLTKNDKINNDILSMRSEYAYPKNKIKPNILTEHNNNFKQHTFRNTVSLSQNVFMNATNQSSHHFLQNGVYDNARLNKTGQTDFRETIKDNTMLTDCTNKLKQNMLKNNFSLGSNKFNSTCHNTAQRFTKSQSVLPIPEETNNIRTKNLSVSNNGLTINNHTVQNSGTCVNTDTDDDNIFSEITDPERSILKQPHSNNLDTSYETYSQITKKAKLSSPKKSTQNQPVIAHKSDVSQPRHNVEKDINDFVFVKPSIPLRKPKPPENNNTAVPTIQVNAIPNVTTSSEVNTNQRIDDLTVPDEHSETLLSDISSRPSFMKRKLFTQTLDMTERKSNDSSPGISPKKIYEDTLKEKSKTRKLVTNQSCLKRDINGEDNNLLDLIHKIVPPEQMNVTSNITQKPENMKRKQTLESTNNNNEVKEQRWDINSILSTCVNDDVSDTYTDEEIFGVKGSKKKIDKNKSNNKTLKVVLEKVNIDENKKNVKDKQTKPKTSRKSLPKNKEVINNVKLAHDFWNTDSESETPVKLYSKNNTAVNKQPINCNTTLSNRDIKSLLEKATSSNEISLHLKVIHENLEQISNNRSLRLCALKVLKEKHLTTNKHSKPNELQKSIYDILIKDKRDQLNNNSFINSSASPIAKQSCNKNNVKNVEVKKCKVQDNTCINYNGSQNQKSAKTITNNLNNKTNVHTNSDVQKPPPVKTTDQTNLNVSKTSRTRKVKNISMSPPKYDVFARRITLRNRTLETPNISSEQDSLNISERTRGRTKTKNIPIINNTFINSSAFPIAKQSCDKNNVKKVQVKKCKVQDNTCINYNGSQNQKSAKTITNNLNNKTNVQTNSDVQKPPPVKTTDQTNLNVSLSKRRRGRPKKVVTPDNTALSRTTHLTKIYTDKSILEPSKGVKKTPVSSCVTTLNHNHANTKINKDFPESKKGPAIVHKLTKTDSVKLQEKPRITDRRETRLQETISIDKNRELVIDDDAKSITARSVTSQSFMTRSRRLKFLHV